MRYSQTAIQVYERPATAWPIKAAEFRGLLVSTAGFIVFVAMFAFLAFGDSLG
ncbi:MAG: hypothetical protein IAG13_22960 [Deltaproteobacteria bacterium]|nr:hypothetical protein [Nannocystaceae bacterium]